PAVGADQTLGLEDRAGGLGRALAGDADRLAHARAFLIHWSAVTAMITSRPMKPGFQNWSRPARLRPLSTTATMRAPIRVPTIRPRPPNRLVPPMTTAVMESRLASTPLFGLAAPTRPTSTHDAIAKTRPATT